MKIIALTSSYNPEGTTATLALKALEGAASIGAETELIMLKDYEIHFCTNCLTCYKDLESEIARCSIKDDVRGILETIRDSDGIILSSPLHSGFINGLMTTFCERASFTLCRPTGELMGLKGIPEPRLTDGPRGSVTIVNAGMVPKEFRKYCDTGTPWLKDLAQLLFNGEVVGDMFAGGGHTKDLKEDEWSRAFLKKKLSEDQLSDSYDLGAKLAEALKSGRVRPYDPELAIASLVELAKQPGS